MESLLNLVFTLYSDEFTGIQYLFSLEESDQVILYFRFWTILYVPAPPRRNICRTKFRRPEVVLP